jgi:type IX secretion system PorP/SprF family membrane protein
MMRRYYYLVTFLFFSIFSYGQDAIYTLLDHNPLGINPAYALPSNCELQVSSNSRQQWWNLPGASSSASAYNLNQLSIIYPAITSLKGSGLGLGIQLNRNNSGEGNLAMTDVNFDIASNLQINSGAIKQSIKVGVAVGIKQYTLDWNQLTFSSQLDPYLGLVNPDPIVNPRIETSSLGMSRNFGFIYSNFIQKRSIFGNIYDISNSIGAALFQANNTQISFFDQNAIIPQRISIHGTIKLIPYNSRGLVSNIGGSYFLLRHNHHRQSSLRVNETRFGMNFMGSVTTYVGLRRRNFLIADETIDAVLWSAQINLPGIMVSVGYDFTVSPLNIQRTRGTTEIGVTIPLGCQGNLGIKGRRASEPCYVDYLLKHAEWKAVEKFNNKSTDWGREYSPITFIL